MLASMRINILVSRTLGARAEAVLSSSGSCWAGARGAGALAGGLILPRGHAVGAHRVSTVTFAREGLVQDGEYAQRRNKSKEKREVAATRDLAKKLCSLPTDKLIKMELSEDLLDTIGVAQKLSQRDKGRHRQEKLLAKKIYAEYGEVDEVDELLGKVEGILSGKNVFGNPRAERAALAWREALAVGSKEVETMLFGYPNQWMPDRQNMRNLIRKVQEETAKAQAAADAKAAEDAELSGAVGEGEGAAGGGGATGGARKIACPSTPSSKKLLHLLRAMSERAVEAEVI